MNKLLNNLLGMYKQAKLNKKAEEVVEDVEDIEKWFSVKLDNDQAKEFTKLLTENNIKNKSKKAGEEIRVSFFLLPSSIGVAQGLLAATLSKFPDKQASTIKKAEEDLIEVGWGLGTNTEEEIKDNAEWGDSDNPRETDKTFWDKINKDIENVENAFLKDGYKQFFTKVRDEGHHMDGVLGGTAWMTKEQLKDFIERAENYGSEEYVLSESSGSLDLKSPIDYDESIMFSVYVYVDDKDLNELGIESKRVSKNKKLSSKNTKLAKKASAFKVVKMTNNDFVDLSDSIKDVGDELWGILYGKIVNVIAVIIYENKVLYEPLINDEETQKIYDEAQIGSIETVELLPGDDTYADMGFVVKESSKGTKLTKKAKEYGISDYLNHFNDVQQYVLTENKGDLGKAVEDLLGFASSEYDKARFPREYVYKLVKEYIDDTIKFQEMINHPIKEEYIVKAKELLNKYKVENKIANSIKTLHKKSETFDGAEEFAKKIIEDNKYAFSGHTDMAKLENNAYSMFLMDNASIKEVLDEAKKIVSELDNDKDKKFEDAGLYFGMKDRALLAEKVLEEKTKQEKQSSKAKVVRKQAKYEETVQGDEKVKDSAKSFGYDIKFAGHYGKWIYYYLIDEKGNIIRDDKEYQKVYDEMKKRIDDDIDIDNYAFAKGLIEEVDGELMRVPTIVISEYSLLSNHKDREENTGLEEFKRDFNLSSSTKKQAEGKKYYAVAESGTNFGSNDNKEDLKEEIRDFVVAHKDNFEKKEKIYLKESDTDKTIEEIIVRDILTPYGSKKWVIVATKKQATIKHENGVYNVYSESGKCLGKGYKTKEEAEKRLKQVEYFKNKKAVTGTDYWGPKEIPDEEEEGTFIIRYYGGPGHIDYLRKSRNGKYHWVEQTHFDYINDKPFETTDYELAKKLVEQYGGEIEKKESKQVNNKRTSLKQVVISKMAKIKK